MTVPVVYVPQPVHDRALALLARHAEVRRGFGPAAVGLQDVLPDVHGIVVRTDPITADDLARAPHLRVIARHGIGVDQIDVAGATARGVVVCNTPEANVQAVAEHTFALLLAVGRRLIAADRTVRSGRFADRDGLTGIELSGRQLGIVGMGRIGTAVARIGGHGFGMHVVGFDPALDPATIRQRGAEPAAGLDELLQRSDVLTVHVPLTAATRGLIGATELARMPAHAVVLQASRGDVIDEDALVAALRAGRLAGAGVDVFASEPPAADCGYFTLPNVVLSPHTGAHTTAAMERMAVGAAEAVLAALRGETPDGVVNPEVLTSPAAPRAAAGR